MFKFRYLVSLVCLLYGSSLLAQKEDWLPVTPQDLQIKEVPGNPGAAAIQLYYADYIDDQNGSEFIYHRIKILNEKGREPGAYADVEILIRPGFSIDGLKARTIHPDGQIVDFSGKPFEKTVIKGKGIKFVAKAFTLPDVTVGSIVEYKYRTRTPENVVYNNSWTIQHPLFTVKESLRFKAFDKPLDLDEGGGSQVSYTTTNLSKTPIQKGSTVELEMENVPAFEAEGFMPPEDNYKPQVSFFYGGYSMSSIDKFWQERAKKWRDEQEHFVGNHKEVRDAAIEAIAGETDPEKKLRKLYSRAQQVRNLTYERDRTSEEEKKEKLKPNDNAVDVLQRGHGTRRDITLLFVALARAAGLDATMALVSNRQDKFFEMKLPDRRQLDSELAVVQMDGKDAFFDPGTKFCPYGFVRWPRTSTSALKLDKKGGSFVTVPTSPHDKSVVARKAKVTLGEDGSLKGDLAVEFKGGEALERRLDAFHTDEEGRKKSLEDEVKGWLTSGAFVKMTAAQGWEATDEPLVVNFSLEIPGYASQAGKRLLMPSYLFQAKQKEAFKSAERKFPVYFPYAFAEQDMIMTKLPVGYALEGTPAQQEARLPYAAYQCFSQFDGTQLVTQRALLFNGIFMAPAQYPEVKGFFNKVQVGDEQQAVLRVGPGVNAHQ